MTTDRPYRRALGTAVAIAELRANSGTQFDPRVVEAFVAMIEAGVVEEVDPAGQLDESEPVTV
jgi:HD-GYP domain-containing protein (c-di-GMP phosphodiesterase class II)